MSDSFIAAGLLHTGPATSTRFGAVAKGISLSSFSLSSWSARYVSVSPGDDFPGDGRYSVFELFIYPSISLVWTEIRSWLRDFL